MDKALLKYPLVISHPRSGWHWLSALIEMYFDKVGRYSWRQKILGSKRTDYGYVHDHDEQNKVAQHIKKHRIDQPILYLWREPVNVVYSLIRYRMKRAKRYGETYREWERACSHTPRIAELLQEHYRSHSNAKHLKVTVVKYEQLLVAPAEEFRKVCHFFGGDYSEPQVAKVFEACSRCPENRRILDITDNMVAPGYDELREEFKDKWAHCISETVKAYPE